MCGSVFSVSRAGAGQRTDRAETWSCAGGQKMITRARKARRPDRQSRAQVAFSCGQPVQNLCLDWAQYIEFAAIET
jgi:hypothetical protein